MTPTINFVVITPKLAAEFMTKNNNNYRSFRPARSAHYAQIIRDGGWKITHQGVAFDINGNLCDGQHRLAAIIETGIPVTMAVSYGLDVSATQDMDCGMIRSIANRLGLPPAISAVCSLAVTCVTGDKGSKIATGQIQNMYNKLSYEFDVFNAHATTTTKRGLSTSVIKLAVVLLLKEYQKDNGKCQRIIENYKHLVNRSPGLLTPIQQAFLNQLDKGEINPAADAKVLQSRSEILLKAHKALHPACEHLTRMVIKNAEIKDNMDRVKMLLS